MSAAIILIVPLIAMDAATSTGTAAKSSSTTL
jgi:hypothetical protein